MKRGVFIVIVLIMLSSLVIADGDFTQAEELIKNNVPCSQLSDVQLNLLGEYYMEQMYPDETHPILHEMIVGKAQLFQLHGALARSFYCGDHAVLQTETMNFLMGRSLEGFPMLVQSQAGMSPTGYGATGYPSVLKFTSVLYILLLATLIVLIVWLIWNSLKKKR